MKPKMKLVVGSNGNLECTNSILKASDSSIDELYLSIKNSVYSSGRPDVVELELLDLEEHLKLAKLAQVNLSVAFNATCYSGLENTTEFRKEYYQFLEALEDAGVDRVILAHPILIDLTKKYHPQLHVSVSSFNMIDNETKVGYFVNLGADRIILAAELNRHPKKLRSIIEKYPQTEFEVILNNGCNYYCPFEYSHGSSQSHMHQFQGIKNYHYPAECIRELLTEKWKILISPFIRPEDVHFYGEIGIKFFKIAGRNTTTEWILNVLNAYQRRSYDKNIVDLLNRTYKLSGLRNKQPKIDIPNKRLSPLLKMVADSDNYLETCERIRRLYEVIQDEQ